MADQKRITPLSELGEFGLIKHLTKDISLQHSGSIKGIGDDAAVLDSGGKQIVVTTDLLLEGVHFNLVYTPLKHLGYKAIIVNLSDVFAMNAVPGQVTVSVAVSGKFSLEAMEQLYDGLKLACRQYGVDFVGGDTTTSITGLTICVTAIGELDTGDPWYRTGAKQHDLICVSGNLGAAYMGLQLLERERKVFEDTQSMAQPDFKGYEYLLERQLKPEARADIIRTLRDQKITVSAMIDLSDGLSSDLLHICEQSGLGCRIFQDKIPIDQETVKAAREMNMEPFICALNGGEDYELLFTVPLEHYDKVMQLSDVTIIGHMVEMEGGAKMVTEQGSEIVLTAQGWDALSGER